MADAFAIAEKYMTAAVVATTTLVFKAQIHIRASLVSPSILMVGELPISKEVFHDFDPKKPSELSINGPWWQLDCGERDIPGLNGLQRRISSSVEGRVGCWFIPCDYLMRIVEN